MLMQRIFYLLLRNAIGPTGGREVARSGLTTPPELLTSNDPNPMYAIREMNSKYDVPEITTDHKRPIEVASTGCRDVRFADCSTKCILKTQEPWK